MVYMIKIKEWKHVTVANNIVFVKEPETTG